MKTFVTLIFSFIILIVNAQENLLPVHNQTSFGYINLKGDTVLPFKYKNVNLFSEGLAAVREKGHFGFIDTKGNYILPPSYDYAEDFSKGYAKVWIKGICYLINKNGKPLFVGEYIDLDWDRKSDTINVTTITNRIGAVNKDGKILLDTIAQDIRDYYESGSPSDTEYFGEKYQKAFVNGKVGIITRDRKFVLPPKYQTIEFITDNLLLVSTKTYHNIFVIDLNENILLDSIFDRIYEISNFALEVHTKETNKCGLLNLDFNYVFDTIYREISHLGNSYFELENSSREKGLFHFNGDTIVPFGKYKSFGGGGKDYFLVEFVERIHPGTLAFGVINKKGKLINKWYLTDFESRYLQFNIFTIEDDEYIDIERKADKKRFQLNFITGELSPKENLGRKEDKDIFRAYLKKYNSIYKLHDWNGKLVSNKVFANCKDEKDSTGNFIVSPFSDSLNVQKWGIIDTLGNYQILPIYTEIEKINEQNDFFIVTDTGNKKGIFSIDSGRLIIPNNHFSSFSIIKNDVIIARGDSLEYWFNKHGKQIWTRHRLFKERSPNSYVVTKLDIDFQYKPRYNTEVGDFKKEKKEKWFGAAYPQYVFDVQSNIDFPKGQLSIIIDTSAIDTIKNEYFGHPMYVVNFSLDTLAFASQDGRLYLKMQALDENGVWRDIDHLANSWCGNSYGLRWLQPNGLWQFSVPIYNGNIKTKLRMALIPSKLRVYSENRRYYYYNELKKNKNVWIYSKPFDGYINPAQFWRKLNAPRFSLYRN